MPRAFVFPGQGSQAVGMGKALADALPEARLVFEEVDDALSQKLSKLMFEGPEDQLTLTENAQPALMAVSMAIIRTLQSAKIDLPARVAYMAGHSLGEYSALAAAGAISLGDAARLLKIRGQAMQRAVPVGQGAMAALLGAEIDQALEVVAEAAQGGHHGLERVANQEGADSGAADHHHLERCCLQDDVEMAAGEHEAAEHHHEDDHHSDDLEHTRTHR